CEPIAVVSLRLIARYHRAGSQLKWRRIVWTQEGDESVKPAIRRVILFSGMVAAIVAGGFFFIVTFRDEILAVFLHPGEIFTSFWPQDQRGPQVVFNVEPDGGDPQTAVDESIRVLKRRLDELAVRALVQQQGPAQIVVQLPHSANAEELIQMLTRRG